MPVKRSGRGFGTLMPKIRANLRAAVYEIAADVQADAQISITAGSVSGKEHVPSAPGTPPNNDTGHLADSIEVEEMGPLRARVVVHAEYGAIQELGGTIKHRNGATITLPERPYMRPAAQKNKEPGVRKMRAAIQAALKDKGA